MPAVQIARLKEQVNNLLPYWDQPVEFNHRLNNLLFSYANWVYHPGQDVQASALLPEYHCSHLVIRQLEQQLGPLCQHNSSTALALADQLWSGQYLEVRLLAAFLLGQLPAAQPEYIVKHIRNWVTLDLEDHLLLKMLEHAGMNLRHSHPENWLALAQDWLHETDPAFQKIGLLALWILVQQADYINFPPIYRATGILLQTTLPELQPALQKVLASLAQRSPVETTFFLRSTLINSANPDLARIVRRILPQLPPDCQVSLRTVLKDSPSIPPKPLV